MAAGLPAFIITTNGRIRVRHVPEKFRMGAHLQEHGTHVQPKAGLSSGHADQKNDRRGSIRRSAGAVRLISFVDKRR
jgi:hypothetical protein